MIYAKKYVGCQFKMIFKKKSVFHSVISIFAASKGEFAERLRTDSVILPVLMRWLSLVR